MLNELRRRVDQFMHAEFNDLDYEEIEDLLDLAQGIERRCAKELQRRESDEM